MKVKLSSDIFTRIQRKIGQLIFLSRFYIFINILFIDL